MITLNILKLRPFKSLKKDIKKLTKPQIRLGDFKTHITYTGFIPIIYKELLQLNKEKINRKAEK